MSRERDGQTVVVRIGNLVADEYLSRSPGFPHDHPEILDAYRMAAIPGSHTMTVTQAAEIMDDAEFYAEPGGPGDAIPANVRAAYRRLHNQIQGKLRDAKFGSGA